MPIIKATNDKRVSVKAKVLEETFTEMNDYIKWAEVGEVSSFVEQAIQYVLENDKDWKRHKNGA